MNLTPEQQIERYMLMRTLYWQQHLQQLDNQTIAQMLVVLQGVKRDLEKKLVGQIDIISGMETWSETRAKEVGQWIDSMTTDAEAALTSGLTTTSVAAAQASISTYNSVFSFNGMAKAVKTVGLTNEQLTSWFSTTVMGDRQMGLGAWVTRAFENGARASLLESLQRSVVEGKGTAEQVKRLLQEGLDKGFDITGREATTIARTYTALANGGAMQEVYRKNESLISGYRRYETLDNYTCIVCAPMDGVFYSENESRPYILAHPRCRGGWLPVVKSMPELGLSFDDFNTVSRPWTEREDVIAAGGAKVANFGTHKGNFAGWWETQPRHVQVQSVGEVRARLLNEGKITFADMTDKPTGQSRTLEQMGFDRMGNKL